MDFIIEAEKQNKHWETGRISFPRLEGRLVERKAFADLAKAAKTKFITIIRGMRRTGKSVAAKRLLSDQISSGKNPREVAWFEFDRDMNAGTAALDSLISFFLARGASLIVLDEIQFISGWQDVLKRHYDRTDVKFILTGSSALELDRRAGESLAGRFELVRMEPFSFGEFLGLQKQGRITEYEKAANRELLALEAEGYLRAGGLPEAAARKTDEDREKYMKESVLDPLFYKDLPPQFPGTNPDMLRKTLDLLAATAGSTYQLQTLASALGCSHPTAGTQVEVLERALLVRTMFNKTASIVKQKRTAKKISFADNCLLFSLNKAVPAGVLAENAAINAYGALLFWRDSEGREVDFLVPEKKLAFEVKYQESISSRDERNLEYFLERNRGWKGVLITKNESESSGILRIPLWKALLEPWDCILGK